MEETSKKSTPLKKSETIEINFGKYLSDIRENPWIAATFVLGLVVIFLLISGTTGASIGTVTADEAAEKTIQYINSNPDFGVQVDLGSAETTGSYHRVLLNYQGQDVPVFTTLDGKFLFTAEPLNLDGAVAGGAQPDAPVQRVDAVTDDDDPALGKADAPITIIEFSDYQCPFCAKFWSDTLPQIKEEYISKGLVRLVFRDFPLSIHPMAQPAAEAAECVRDAGNDKLYFEYHDKIFANQGSLSEENLIKWANEVGVSIDKCFESHKFKDEVEKDLADGESYGVTGTPGFFVNGVKLDGALPFEQFKQVIDAELAALA